MIPCKRIILDYSLTPCTKNKLKIDLNIGLEIKFVKENWDSILFKINFSNTFWISCLTQREPKQKLSNSKGNYPQHEMATYWMGETICKWYIWKVANTENIQRTQHKQTKKNPRRV